jgi:L-methionine (R)-S-oxide reductase
MQNLISKEKKYDKILKLIKSNLSNYKSDYKQAKSYNHSLINYSLDILYNKFPDWIFCGIYKKIDGELTIDLYHSDKIPCSPISFEGVCGQSIQKNSILNVPDVDKFPGHIVCDNNSKSELCIPFKIDDIVYVLDIDSCKSNDFDKTDEINLLEIIKIWS